MLSNKKLRKKKRAEENHHQQRCRPCRSQKQDLRKSRLPQSGIYRGQAWEKSFVKRL